jgi:predicted ABC-type ATPase
LLRLPILGHTTPRSYPIANQQLSRLRRDFPAALFVQHIVSTKELTVVGGPNGAGKSTFVAAFLADRPLPYLCADSIAREFQQLDPVSQQIAAGREFLLRIEKQLATNQDFIIESTLSGRSLRTFLAKARAAGYSITIVFIYLNSADTCVARIKQRVRRGGHNVPEVDIRRRFPRSCANFWQMYREIADQWVVIYNAGSGFVEIAFGFSGEFAVSDEDLFEEFLKYAEHSSNG